MNKGGTIINSSKLVYVEEDKEETKQECRGKAGSDINNPFEGTTSQPHKREDPFAPNPSLRMKVQSTFNKLITIGSKAVNIKDPFASKLEQKDPFAPEKDTNPFESGKEGKDNAAFKSSGLSLGLKDMNGFRPPVSMGSHNNVFKTGIPSPMGAYFPTGIDSGRDLNSAFYYPYQRVPMSMFSPSGAASNSRGNLFTKRGIDQSPRIEISKGIFQTPISKTVAQQPGDMSTKREDSGSFGGSPKDISTTKAVFNQQTKFSRNKCEETPSNMRQVKGEVITPTNNYFTGSPYGMVSYQPAFFIPQMGNTPTGWNFPPPPSWCFNIPSPHTGNAGGQGPQFNSGMTFVNKEGSVQDNMSPKFNSVSESNKHPITGQDSTRQFSNNLAPNFLNMQNIPQNYAMSPNNAFSFSCKSGKLY